MQNPEREPPVRRTEEPINENYSEGDEYTDAYTAYDITSSSAPALPSNGLRRALIIGGVAGLVMALIYFLIPFLNAQAFQQSAVQGAKMSYSTAVTVTTLSCLGVFLALVICTFTGYLVGRYAVRRRLGFIAGLLAGAIFYLGIFVSGYIPIYPGSSATPPFSARYILSLLIITPIIGCLGGLISLLVTWMTTRRHPYYTDT